MYAALLALVIAQAPSAEARIGIAVLNPVTSGDVAADVSPVLAGLVATRLDKSGVFRVVAEDDVRQMVSFDQMKTALSCDDQASCLAEIGQALGVPFMMTSSLAKIGDTLVFQITLIDINAARVQKRESGRYASMNELLAGIDAQVERAVQQLMYREQGILVVTANEVGAVVEIDGVAVGTTPLAEQQVPSGPHRVTVSKETFIRFVKDVVVQPQQKLAIDVKLEPINKPPPPDDGTGLRNTGAIVGGSAGALFVVSYVALSYLPVALGAPGEITNAVLIPVVGPFMAVAQLVDPANADRTGDSGTPYVVLSASIGVGQALIAATAIGGGVAWAVGTFALEPPMNSAGLGWRIGMIGGGVAALAGGGAIDLLSPTSSNHEVDVVDFIPPVLYVAGAAAPIIGIAINPFEETAE
jgi:hypothetical protein